MIIGIDPDIQKSGVACLHANKNIDLNNMSFVQIVDFVRLNKSTIKCVYLEAGWLNLKSSWHPAINSAVASRIGKSVGENHATGKLLQQCIEHEHVKVILVRPTKSKLNAEQFAKLTGIKSRTNSETRDAAMLVWGR